MPTKVQCLGLVLHSIDMHKANDKQRFAHCALFASEQKWERYFFFVNVMITVTDAWPWMVTQLVDGDG